MDREVQQKLRQLLDRIFDIRERVTEVREQGSYTSTEVKECRRAIESVVADYQALYDQVPAEQRAKIEIRYGRQVTDLRRHASWIPERSRGTPVSLATDDQWSRASRLPEKREVDTVSDDLPARQAPPRPKTPSGPRVGGEVEAWCGPCKGLRGHTIVAIVGGEAKQVICQSCGGRHGFRLTPARGKGKSTVPKKKGKLTREERESLRKEEERAALQKELVEAEEVREFSKTARYRAGEIIEHPDYGRGKIENVIKGSILVRFRSGLRPISMY